MKTERWRQIERLYHSTLEKPAGERPAFLAAACGGDQELRREVESLLVFEDQAAGFIESPAVEVAARMVAAERGTAVAPGETIQQYRITSPLGAGGMGEVYLAEDTRLGRRIALKFLPAHWTRDTGQLRRFEREARAVAALSHPNVCTIHEVIETAEGRHCLVMEYIDGVTLRERMAAGRMEVGEALDIAIQVASALSAAHAAGVVHRDIKPENIMLRRDGYVKILDFGLAKRSERQAADAASGTGEMSLARTLIHTSPGVVMGTVSYMSPEQARGLEVDARTDVWSLGVVLYEMVAGERPFEGATLTDVMVAVVERAPAPLARRASDAPVQLDRIVQRALAKDREERYPSAEDLRSELKGLRQELETATAVSTPRERPLVPPAWAARSKVALALAAAAVVAIVAAFDVGGWREQMRASRAPAIRSIAILPLQNLSGGADQDYFAEGMTDALIGNLSKVGALRVISRTSTMRYQGTKASLPQIARELSVDGIVEGSVLRSGQRVRISARLSHAPSDRSLWAESYERDLVDVLALQRELAQAITREIRVNLTRDEQARLAVAPAVDPEVYQAYMKGLHRSHRRDEKGLREAVEYFQQALGRDPSYAPAYAGIADCYAALASVQGGRPPRDLRPLATAAAERALALDDELAEAHFALANTRLFDWQWSAAEHGFRRAIQLNPSLALARRGFSQLLLVQGRTEEALWEARRAQELDPLSPRIREQIPFVLLNARRYDEAIEHYRSLLELEPGYSTAHWFLGVTYAEKGLFPEAIAQLQAAVDTSGRNPAMLGSLGSALASSGRRAEALALLEELTALSKRGYVTPAAFVHLYTGLGDKDRAFQWLDQAAQERSNLMVFLPVHPPLDPLRTDPRFDDLLRRVGLPPRGRRSG